MFVRTHLCLIHHLRRTAVHVVQVFTWFTPGFMRPAEQWVEDTVRWWVRPPIGLATNVLYGTIAWFDGLVSESPPPAAARTLHSVHCTALLVRHGPTNNDVG
jgi:hypothetical protein